MTHTEYVRKYDTRHRPNFDNSPAIGVEETNNLHLPAWRSVRQSSNPIIKQIQIKRLQNFEGIISTSRLKNGGCALLKQKEQQGTHHFHFKKRRFVSKGTSGAAVWLGCFTEAAGGMDTAGSHVAHGGNVCFFGAEPFDIVKVL